MKIFIDVGSHFGETINEVIKYKYNFDLIYCIEPSLICINILKKINDNRIILVNAAFSNTDKESILYKSGELGATILENSKDDSFTKLNTEKINLIKTSDWFKKNINSSDIVYVKLNCEGSECEIINDLIINNQLSLIFSILITFDIREFDHLKDKEIITRNLLTNTKLNNYCFADDVMIGTTHEKRIEHWLNLFGATENLSLLSIKKNYFNIQSFYSNKTGKFYRFENNIKILFGYNKFPLFIKFILRKIKKTYLTIYRLFS